MSSQFLSLKTERSPSSKHLVPENCLVRSSHFPLKLSLPTCPVGDNLSNRYCRYYYLFIYYYYVHYSSVSIFSGH
jgi:hypothetical protein